jgi:2-amino-4-hydroxy-6-hydroxymethyldihydropteridine diphosphokinase
VTAVTAAIGLGASLGDRRRALAVALAALAATPGVDVVAVSRLYRTPPAGGVARGWFLNAVVLVRTTLEPGPLLARCRAIEARLGRRPAPRWADRVLDLDLLLHGERVQDGRDPVLPHPRMAERPFVIVPLLEVAPQARDPRTGRPFTLPPTGVRPVAVGVLRVKVKRR